MTKQWEPLADYQWAAISPFFNLKRKRKVDLRQAMKPSYGSYEPAHSGEI